MAYTASTVQFFYDGNSGPYGAQVLPSDFGTHGGGTAALTVGYGVYNDTTNGISGAINELDVWDTALNTTDPTEVTTLYNSGLGLTSDYPEADFLVAGYHLQGDTGDFTGSGHNGALVGEATLTTPDENEGFRAVASCYGTFTAAGDSAIEADFTSTAYNYDDNSATVTEQVRPGTTTTLGAPPPTPAPGSDVALTATVSPAAGYAGSPGGTVEFFADSADSASVDLARRR